MRVRLELEIAWTPRTRRGTRVLGVLGVRAFPSSNYYKDTSGFWEEEKKEADVTTSSDRRRMTIDPRTASQANADDIRVDSIAAQLEEAEQQRLTDDWLEEQQHPDADAWHRTCPAGKTKSRHDDKRRQ